MSTRSIKSTKVRPKVYCHCKKCNGKLVETRTRSKHEVEEDQPKAFVAKTKKDKEKAINQTPAVSKKHSRSISVKTDIGPSQNNDDDSVMIIDHDPDENLFI